MIRKATAVWTGTLKEGAGNLSSTSGVLQQTPYAFNNRFEDVPGTNPEELVAAAHAGCYSMALSGAIGRAGFTAERIETTASVTLETVDGKPTVTRSDLSVVVSAPGMPEADLRQAAEDTKSGCPISRLLNAEMALKVTIL